MSRPLSVRSAVLVALVVVVAAGSLGVARAQDPAEPLRFVATEGDGSTPRADDVVRFGGWNGMRLFRGPTEAPRLEADGPRVFEIDAEGKRTLVGLRVSAGSMIGAAWLPPEEAVAVPSEALAGLRGLRFVGWSEGFEPMLRGIDPERCVLEIPGGRHGRLPALPAGLRALRIQGSTAEPLDLSPLATQLELRLLAIDRATVSDWSALAGVKGLRHLEAEITADAAATVPALPELRSYSAGSDDSVVDVSFLARCPELRDVDLHGTGVTDLSPLEGLRHVVTIDATNSPISRLPSGVLPSLRKLEMLGHHVSPEVLRAFLDANPRCSKPHSRQASLDAKTVGVDGLRLRAQDWGLDQHLLDVLFESRDAAELRALLAMIAIDEREGGGICRCLGGAKIELLRGGEIAATLTVYHGAYLLWRGSRGKAKLTDESADALCTWLTAHGAPTESPGQIVTRKAGEDRARAAEQDRLLGKERGAAARATSDMTALGAIARAVEPETDARIVLLIRLAALDGGNDESDTARPTKLAREALREEDATRLAAVLLATLTSMETPPDLRRAAAGTVRDLNGGRSPLVADVLATLRIPAARAYIRTDDPEDRHLAVWLLRSQDTPESDELAISLLPALGEDGQPVRQPTKDDMDLAFTIVRFCALEDMEHIRKLAVASRHPDRWLESIDHTIGRRREK